MSLRKFLAVQVLMLAIYILIDPELNGLNVLTSGIVINFAVFSLPAMLVGYTEKDYPLANALAASFAFNAAFYSILIIAGAASMITVKDLVADFGSMAVFTLVGCLVGLHSRPEPQDDDPIN